MNHREFENLCERAHSRAVFREDSKGGVIVIADGDDISAEPHVFRTVWAFGRDESDLEVGRPLHFDRFYVDNGVSRLVTQEIRVAAALNDARQYAESRNG